MFKFTDIYVRSLTPRDKLYRIADSAGLTIEVKTNGKKYWRYRYRFNGKASMVSLGAFPSVLLAKARSKAMEHKDSLSKGINPSAKQVLKIEGVFKFEELHSDWLKVASHTWAPKTLRSVKGRLKNHFKRIAQLDIKSINSEMLLALLREVEDKGTIYTAQKCKAELDRIFSHAVWMKWCDSNPVSVIPSALFKKYVKKNLAFTIDEKFIDWILNLLEGDLPYSFSIIQALRMAPHLFLRPQSLSGLMWSEVDFNKKMINITKDRMKSSREHLVPLSEYVLSLLRELKNTNACSVFVFPSPRKANSAISPESLRAGLRRAKVSKEQLTTHGFRHMASTLLHEQGFNSDLIELQLAHELPGRVRAVYNHAQNIPERAAMMEAWSTYLRSFIKQPRPLVAELKQ